SDLSTAACATPATSGSPPPGLRRQDRGLQPSASRSRWCALTSLPIRLDDHADQATTTMPPEAAVPPAAGRGGGAEQAQAFHRARGPRNFCRGTRVFIPCSLPLMALPIRHGKATDSSSAAQGDRRDPAA